MTNPTITCLTELQERLKRAVQSLHGLREDAWDQGNKNRLGGKIEGVKIALGYIEEELRELQRHESIIIAKPKPTPRPSRGEW